MPRPWTYKFSSVDNLICIYEVIVYK